MDLSDALRAACFGRARMCMSIGLGALTSARLSINRDGAMSFITTPANHRYPWYVRLVLYRQRRHYGLALEPSRLWGRTPRAFLAMALMYGVLDRKRSPIEPSLRSLVQVLVSQINWCAFCVDLNSATSLQRGISEEVLCALAEYPTSPLFSDREKAALAFAETVTRSDRRTDAVLIDRVRTYFDDDAIIELAALVAYQNMSGKFNAALGVPAQGFCRISHEAARGISSGTSATISHPSAHRTVSRCKEVHGENGT